MHLTLAALCIVGLLSARASASVCQKPPRKSLAVDTVTACDPKPLIYDNEGCKECVYLDTRGIKTIGIGFNLQRSDAQSILASVGANYSAIVNGPVTATKTPCNCGKVTCLTQDQIDKIFQITVEGASNDAQSLVATFASLCCPVQNAIVDMSFTLGKTTFATFKTVIYWLINQNWKASADDLRTTKWCQVQASRRCNADADSVQTGCGCTGLLTQKCDGVSSACCKEDETCCKGTLTFKNYITKTEEELLCCPVQGAVCCKQNKCCHPQYPICCPPNYCCSVGARCVSGKCYSFDGKPGQGIPASVCSRAEYKDILS